MAAQQDLAPDHRRGGPVREAIGPDVGDPPGLAGLDLDALRTQHFYFGDLRFPILGGGQAGMTEAVVIIFERGQYPGEPAERVGG